MFLHCTPKLLAAGAASVSLAAFGWAAIERLDLRSMVAKTDGAVAGTIVAKQAIRIDHPVDGPELYYTHLTVAGRSLVTGETMEIVVTYPGGWIDEEHGAHNSEAPAEDDTRIGTEVVVFHKWTDNMGGDLAAHGLYASHGGLFRVVHGRKGAVVLGRGDGYAVAQNVALAELDERITRIWNELREQK